MATEAQIRASTKHNKKQDSITIRPTREKGVQIRTAASISGQPLQRYILEAIDERMTREAIAVQQDEN